jgi:GNAT superfamily N-acetyltransferase
VGFAGLSDRSARGACAENNLTAVRRDKRGHGIAVALKQALVHWAAERGYRELQTWTQNGNDAMQAVNERVGYRPGHVAITVRGALLP